MKPPSCMVIVNWKKQSGFLVVPAEPSRSHWEELEEGAKKRQCDTREAGLKLRTSICGTGTLCRSSYIW